MYEHIKKLVLSRAACEGTDTRTKYAELFNNLDINKDGKVDILELQQGLKAMGMAVGAGAEEVRSRAVIDCKLWGTLEWTPSVSRL